MTPPKDAPLSFLAVEVLRRLPKEGTRTGFKDIGMTVKILRQHFEGITSEELSGVLKSMEYKGLVTTVALVPLSQGKGYQITKAGQEVLNEHKEEA